MFFTPELLSRRDSGFGLLWLAATLGSRSTFKKLPRRSILTADISQLCDQIAEPQEPLALRLSSNLMVGVVRVYRVKQEIFMTDVSTCFNSLKRMVADMHLQASEAELQMAHPTVRPATVTFDVTPNDCTMDFDNLVADWDEYLNINIRKETDDDADFDPSQRHERSQKQTKARASKNAPIPGNARTGMHTLNEDHHFLLGSSLDLSLSGEGALAGHTSSQLDNFGFDDNIFGPAEGEAGFDIGDELARELGEGWGAPRSITHQEDDQMQIDKHAFDMNADMNFDYGGFIDIPAPSDSSMVDKATRKNLPPAPGKENIPFPESRDEEHRSVTQPLSFTQELVSQDNAAHILDDNIAVKPSGKKNLKRVRLLLDPRTELTDEELTSARSQYLEGQISLQRESNMKRLEKESGRVVEDLIWGIPIGLEAQDLKDFWSDNFKVHVDARSGVIQLAKAYNMEHPNKRRRVSPGYQDDQESRRGEADFDNMEMDVGVGIYNNEPDFGLGSGMDPGRSSEEPGQARNASNLGSQFAPGYGLDVGPGDSQRSSLFPWDHAGASSSEAPGFGFDGSDRVSVERAEVRLRRSRSGSMSRRASSAMPSPRGEPFGAGVSFSPARQSIVGEDFAFDVPADQEPGIDTQASADVGLVTLERNSFNFLEYAKMQFQSLSNATWVTFDHVVPQSTSTRRVAASGFYHCLVLATKDLLRVDQTVPYGTVKLSFP